MSTRCSVFIAVSLDGFIARPNGAIDWLSSVEREGEDYGYKAFFDSVDALVLGRNTYEVALGFEPWPYAGKRCFVLSHGAAAQHGVEIVSGTPGELVERLSGLGVQRAYIDGGQVIQQFLAARRVDDLTLSVLPILLGQGIRLFGELPADLPLELQSSRAFDSGLVQLTYRPHR